MRRLLGIVLFLLGGFGLYARWNTLPIEAWFVQSVYGFLFGAGCGLICLDSLDFSLGNGNGPQRPTKIVQQKPIQEGQAYYPSKPDKPPAGPIPPPLNSGWPNGLENPRPWRRPTDKHTRHLRIR